MVLKAEKSVLPFNNLNALYAPMTHTNMGPRQTYWNTIYFPSLTAAPAPRLPPVNSELRANLNKVLQPPKTAYVFAIPLLFIAGYQIGVQTCRHYGMQFGAYNHYFGGGH
eukprot:UN00236